MTVPGLLPGWPRIALGVAFNVGGTQAGTPFYTDLTARLRDSWTATAAGRQYEMDAVQAGTASFVLDSTDGALDSTNPGGPYYGSITPFRRVRLTATWPPSQNLLPQGMATGSSLADVQVTNGTRTVATVPAAPSGHTQAIAWTYPAISGAQACGLGATNANWAGADSDAVPVIGQPGQAPGQPWTYTVYASTAIGGQAGLQLSARISWYRQDGTRITPVDSTPVTLPTVPGWTRLTLTATAPAGAVWARPAVISPATTVTTTATTVYLTGAQFEQAAAPTPWADPGVTDPLWSGYVERYQAHWPKGSAYGTVTLACSDALAGLARLTLRPGFQQSLAALNPNFVIPFNEPSGAALFADATGQRPAWTVAATPPGAGSATVTAGSALQGVGFNGAAGPVVTITNPNAGNLANLPGMVINAPAGAAVGPPATGGWTRLIAFRTAATPNGPMALWSSSAPGALMSGGAQVYAGPRSAFAIFINADGTVSAGANNADGSAVITVNVPGIVVRDGNWHLALAKVSADGTMLTLSVDNLAYFNTTTGDCHPTGCTTDTIGGSMVAGFSQGLFTGDIAYAVELPVELDVGTALDLGHGFAQGWTGEASATRAQRILTAAGYPGAVATLNTQTTMGAANFAGQNAGGALQMVADSEAGQVYADPAGTITLAGRRWRYLQTAPAVVFGEMAAAGEVPYLDDIQVDLDPDHVYNTVQVTNQVAPNAPQQPDSYASNPASQAAYFPSSLARTINVQDPNEARYAAAYLAGQYAAPVPRVSRIIVDPSANPTAWPRLLGLQFGARARLMRRPNASPNVISLDTYVEQVEWKGDDQGRLTVTVQQSAAAPYSGWMVAAALHTTLAAPASAGATTVTLSALTGAATNPASAVLPAGTVLTIGYGTPAAEQVTVAPGGVAPTSPGYTTVAVTLTAPLASGHATGDAVCQPLPGSVTLPAGAVYPAALDAAATLTATGGPRAAY
ncbi:hypothetical protein ABZW30_30010 [Kitasatospora sp. NPDC004669]|uniref:hypothetical protein n=1 Tax=Kitasatospora sp. NPDC004669 TaxID=3154555 RepID=UPI0033B6EE16